MFAREDPLERDVDERDAVDREDDDAVLARDEDEDARAVPLPLVERLRPVVPALRERDAVPDARLRVVAAALPLGDGARRCAGGISSLTTCLASCGISFCRNAAMRSSWRR